MTTVRAAVIQCNANMSKEEAIDKHVGLIADGRRRRRAGRVPAGDLPRAVLPGRAGPEVVPHRRARGRPDHHPHA